MAGSSDSGLWWPKWWAMFVSFMGIVALFSSHALQLSDAAWPVIAMMIATGPATSVDRWLRRKRDEDD